MLFSSLLDTGSKGRLELELAQALLQLLTLSREGTELTALHAINASLIIDTCAAQSAFRRLVEAGAVRFRNRHDGTRPRQLLGQMLSSPKYVYLGAWPELVNRKDAREAAAALFCGDTTSSGDANIDARMERVESLLKSIEVAEQRYGEAPRELPYPIPYKTLFEQRVRQACESQPGPVAAFLDDLLVQEVSHGTRTDLYREVLQRAPGAEIEKGAIEFADAVSNVLVAESLKAPLHTAYSNPLTRFAHKTEPSHGTVVAFDSNDVADVRKLRLTWKNILAVAPTAPRPLGPGEVDDALEQLADLYAKRALLAPAALESGAEEAVALLIEPVTEFLKSPERVGPAAGAAAAGISTLAIAGPLAALLFTIVGAALGGILGKALEQSYEARRVKRAQVLLTSFMGKVSPP